MIKENTGGNSFSQDIKKDLKIVGWYQVIGGLLGLVIVIKGLSGGVYYEETEIFLYSIVFLLFAFSVFCGWLCLRANRKAISFSMINQYMQSVTFSIGGVAYSFLAGAYVIIGFDMTESFRLFFDWGLTKIRLLLGGDPGTIFVALNLPAILFIYWLYRLKTQVMLEVSIDEADSIGSEQEPINT